MIPEEFCKPPVRKTRYGQTLEHLRALAPRRAVLSHVEEMDRLSHDELVRLGATDGWEPAWDGLVIDLIRSEPVRLRDQVPGHSTSEPTDLGR